MGLIGVCAVMHHHHIRQHAVGKAGSGLAGGPFKPSFGLSGAIDLAFDFDIALVFEVSS
jgi:hypothetical protein